MNTRTFPVWHASNANLNTERDGGARKEMEVGDDLDSPHHTHTLGAKSISHHQAARGHVSHLALAPLSALGSTMCIVRANYQDPCASALCQLAKCRDYTYNTFSEEIPMAFINICLRVA